MRRPKRKLPLSAGKTQPRGSRPKSDAPGEPIGPGEDTNLTQMEARKPAQRTSKHETGDAIRGSYQEYSRLKAGGKLARGLRGSEWSPRFMGLKSSSKIAGQEQVLFYRPQTGEKRKRILGFRLKGEVEGKAGSFRDGGKLAKKTLG